MNFHQDDLSGIRDTSVQVAVVVIKFIGGRVSEKKVIHVGNMEF